MCFIYWIPEQPVGLNVADPAADFPNNKHPLGLGWELSFKGILTITFHCNQSSKLIQVWLTTCFKHGLKNVNISPPLPCAISWLFGCTNWFSWSSTRPAAQPGIPQSLERSSAVAIMLASNPFIQLEPCKHPKTIGKYNGLHRPRMHASSGSCRGRSEKQHRILKAVVQLICPGEKNEKEPEQPTDRLLLPFFPFLPPKWKANHLFGPAAIGWPGSSHQWNVLGAGVAWTGVDVNHSMLAQWDSASYRVLYVPGVHRILSIEWDSKPLEKMR